jgi:hypothetical protein
MNSEKPKPVCDCGGQGVQFRFEGRDMQFRYCPAIDEPDHVPTREEARAKVAQNRLATMKPSGRYG